MVAPNGVVGPKGGNRGVDGVIRGVGGVISGVGGKMTGIDGAIGDLGVVVLGGHRIGFRRGTRVCVLGKFPRPLGAFNHRTCTLIESSQSRVDHIVAHALMSAGISLIRHYD